MTGSIYLHWVEVETKLLQLRRQIITIPSLGRSGNEGWRSKIRDICMYFHCVSKRLHQVCLLKSTLGISFVRIYPYHLDGGGMLSGSVFVLALMDMLIIL